MRLFTKDSDGKFDTPLSVWIGLAFIAVALFFEANNIGAGGMAFPIDLDFHAASGENWWSGWVTVGSADMVLGMNAFFLLTGLTALIPGLLLTMMGRPDR